MEAQMKRKIELCLGVAFGAAIAASAVLAPGSASAQFAPSRPVEFIVPAGSGGGADQMARLIQGVVEKYNLMPQSLVVINLGAGAGAEGFMNVVQDEGNDHKIIITLSNLFTTPLGTGVPFSWEDMTPVTMMALDNFILWVNASTPYQTATEYIEAVAAAAPGTFAMGGTGSKQEDQIITAFIEQQTGVKFTYVPFGGGGEVATQLAGGHINSSVNNPIEQVTHWRAGNTRPLCVFATARLEVSGGEDPWGDVPTCSEAGLDITYQMLRGIFMPAGVSQDAVDYYVGVLGQVREQPEWNDFMNAGAFTRENLTGDEYREWVANAAELHLQLMTNAGFLAS
jgi:tripartite-type tricarboxylate transporter receptor subunit TctC